MKRVGIVIVNYNGLKYQNECIKSIYNMDYKDFDIVVVDSGSSDGSIEQLESEFPEVTVLLQEENVGVAKGNNIGIKYCISNGAEYILLLNNDTILDKNLLSIMMDTNYRENKVIVPKIYYYEPNDLIWFGGGYINWDKACGFHFSENSIEAKEKNNSQLINYAPTCCMLIHKSVFSEIGYIDEKTFMYFDDTDFCARLYEHDIPILYKPEAFMWHKVSSTSGGIESKIGVYYNSRNQLYFIQKHIANIRIFSVFIVVLKKVIKGLLGLFSRNNNNKYILVAYLDFLKGNMGRKDF